MPAVDEHDYLAERHEGWIAQLERDRGLSRRDALRLAAGAAVAVAGATAWPRSARAQSAPASVPGILKAQSPDLLIPRGTNSEMRWAAMRGQGYFTPVDRFFVRNHTSTPTIDPGTWRLQLFGDGLKGRPPRTSPVSLSLDHLQKLEPVTVETAIECAGNGRSFFGSQQGTPAAGTGWTLGAVGVARWRGVRLADVLERSGLGRSGVVDVQPEGLDAEVKGSNGASQGHVRRALPIAKALDDAIIAFEMNGETLPADHGFPARLIVPGWVGIANIKWLGAIEVAKRPLYSTWNTTSYRMVGPTYPADTAPLAENPLKSAFELPLAAVLPAGRRRTLTGRSWSGRAVPRKVEVSTDGGRTFRRAQLETPNTSNAWVRWSIGWTPTVPGKTQLLARATDIEGATQPVSTAFNRDGYWFDAVVKHPVTIAA